MFKSIKFYVNETIDLDLAVRLLDKAGYSRCPRVSKEGDCSLTGETLMVYPVNFEYPIRIDASDDRIQSIKSVDTMTFKAIDIHSVVIILPATTLRRTAFKKPHMEAGEQPIDSFVDIEPGDFIVHVDYGIGKYLGLKQMLHKDAKKDFFVLEYKGGDLLYVESTDLHKLQRYVSFHRKIPYVNDLKGKKWEYAKKKASKGAAKTARDLLTLQARRKSSMAHIFSKDTDWQKEVEDKFPYKETRDQLRATEEVKRDMEKQMAMDRLLCGDVGYGKTEVALRAAFKAVMDGKQVGVLVPTTILAGQHTRTFNKRFKDYPVNIKMLNRFCSGAEQKKVVEDVKTGKVDIVIGTHRLLSNDIEFKDLGLLIIDEEQRFGVVQKNKIKRMKVDVDMLTLTATPIPRTLYLALVGGKDISVIETPPLERLSVATEIIKYDKKFIKGAIEKELARGGQVYFVHNRIETIDKVASEVAALVPSARLLVGHGRMGAKELEKTMVSFINGEVDVLVSTTIIESGIDIPNANTMFVNEADKFGLADLYQLRGRIGRFNRQAFAYLVVRDQSTLTHDVQERLAAMKKYQELGSGFKLAMRDLEMRGAGNILGVEQSGFIDQVGFDLYCRLLREEIERLKK